jgi:bifunctional non-homologous end joining protein LigD
MSITFSNLDRILWPETGFTKGDMIAYYRGVATALLPHLERRPLTLWRFPEGVHRQGFWQNECRGAPDWLATATIRGQRFCVVDDLDSLLWVANLGTIELHPFLFRVEEPDRPTALVLDLDPGPPAGLIDACDIALRLRDSLPGPSFPKTSGGFGLHVYVSIGQPQTFAESKALARGLAESLAAQQPDRVVASTRREERRGKVLVDWLQNDATRSTVAPYSLRGRPRPTVSTPVTWGEVERAAAERRSELLTFGPSDVLDRLERSGDLFAGV